MGEDTEADLHVLVYHNDHNDREEEMSQLSLGEHSYILDLAHQKHFRKARRQEEALEEAMELYNTAVEEGAPKTKELFKCLIAKVYEELQEENREKDRLQDAWLDAALQEELERRENPKNSDLNSSLHTTESLGASFHHPPSIYNGAKNTVLMRNQSSTRMIELDQQIHEEELNILKKKIKKAEKLIQEIIDEKGFVEAQQTRQYKNYKKKIKEYRGTLKKAEQDELKVSRHSAGIKYDWNSEDEDSVMSSDSSKSSTGSKNGRHKQKQHPETERGEDVGSWAKQLSAGLTLADETDDEEGGGGGGVGGDAFVDQPSGKDKGLDLPGKKRYQKNLSFGTAMATTRRMSGHELKSKVHSTGTGSTNNMDSTRKNPVLTNSHLPAMIEGDESEENGALSPTRVRSQSVPMNVIKKQHQQQQTTPCASKSTQYSSPGKRKSPSWKTKTTTTPPPTTTTTTTPYPPPRHTSTTKTTTTSTALNVQTKFVSPDKGKESPRPRSTNNSNNNNDGDSLLPSSSSPSKEITIMKADGSKLYSLIDFAEGRVPDSINMTAWEEYLTPEEFEKGFGMTKEAFEKLPNWKRSNARRQLRTW